MTERAIWLTLRMSGKRHQYAICFRNSTELDTFGSNSNPLDQSYHELRDNNCLYPSSVHLIDTSTHKGALGTQEESYHVSTLFRRSLSLKGSWFVKFGILRSVVHIPCLFHQGSVNGAWGNGVDSNLPVAVLLCCRLRQSDYPVFTGVISTVLSESYVYWLEYGG